MQEGNFLNNNYLRRYIKRLLRCQQKEIDSSMRLLTLSRGLIKFLQLKLINSKNKMQIICLIGSTWFKPWNKIPILDKLFPDLEWCSRSKDKIKWPTNLRYSKSIFNKLSKVSSIKSKWTSETLIEWINISSSNLKQWSIKINYT